MRLWRLASPERCDLGLQEGNIMTTREEAERPVFFLSRDSRGRPLALSLFELLRAYCDVQKLAVASLLKEGRT